MGTVARSKTLFYVSVDVINRGDTDMVVLYRMSMINWLFTPVSVCDAKSAP
jgi:hypothetical protein